MSDLLKPTVTLTTDEAHGLALLLAARQIASDWLEWEDVPWLSEASFALLENEMRQVASNMRRLSRGHDAGLDIDSQYTLERAAN